MGCGVGLEVDLLEVGDRLAELAEVVEDQFARGWCVPSERRHGLLPDPEVLEEPQVGALDVVGTPALALLPVPCFFQDGSAPSEVLAGQPEIGREPCVDHVVGRDLVHDVLEARDAGLHFGRVEEPGRGP